MPRLPLRNHFKRNGKPKKRLSKDEAQAEALRSKKHAYRCDFCDGWHVGGRA